MNLNPKLSLKWNNIMLLPIQPYTLIPRNQFFNHYRNNSFTANKIGKERNGKKEWIKHSITARGVLNTHNLPTVI